MNGVSSRVQGISVPSIIGDRSTSGISRRFRSSRVSSARGSGGVRPSAGSRVGRVSVVVVLAVLPVRSAGAAAAAFVVSAAVPRSLSRLRLPVPRSRLRPGEASLVSAFACRASSATGLAVALACVDTSGAGRRATVTVRPADTCVRGSTGRGGVGARVAGGTAAPAAGHRRWGRSTVRGAAGGAGSGVGGCRRGLGAPAAAGVTGPSAAGPSRHVLAAAGDAGPRAVLALSPAYQEHEQ